MTKFAMKTFLLVFAVSIFVSHEVHAEFEFEWEQRYGSCNEEQVNRCIRTDDGGYLLVGTTNHFELHDNDAFVLKLNSDLEEEWRCIYDNRWDELEMDVVPSPDGGFIVAGLSEDRQGDYENVVFSCKISDEGEVIWEQEYHEVTDAKPVRLLSLHEDQYVLITGDEVREGVLISFLNNEGEVTDTLKRLAHSEMWDALITAEDEMIILSYNYANNVVRLSEFNLNGRLLWTTDLYESNNSVDEADLIQTDNDWYVVAGGIINNSNDMQVVKCNTEGDIRWSETFNMDIVPFSPHIVLVGNDYLIMETERGSNGVVYALAVNANGEQLFRRIYTAEDIGYNLLEISDIYYEEDTGIDVFGTAGFRRFRNRIGKGKDFLYVNMDEDYEIVEACNFGYPNGSMERVVGIVETANGHYFLGIHSEITPNAEAVVELLKTDDEGDSLLARQYRIPEINPVGYYHYVCDGIVDNFGDGIFLWGDYNSQDSSGNWLLYTDYNGDSLWTKYYTPEGVLSFRGHPSYLKPMQDSTFVFIMPYSENIREGVWYYRCRVMKLDRSGDIQHEFYSEEIPIVDAVENERGTVTALDFWSRIHFLDEELELTETIDLDYNNDAFLYEYILKSDNNEYLISGMPQDCDCICSAVLLISENGDISGQAGESKGTDAFSIFPIYALLSLA